MYIWQPHVPGLHTMFSLLGYPDMSQFDIQARSPVHAQFIMEKFAQARTAFPPFEHDLLPVNAVYVAVSQALRQGHPLHSPHFSVCFLEQ